MNRRLLFLISGTSLLAIPSVLDLPVGLDPGVQVDRIVVEKSRRQMTLFNREHAVKTYAVALGRGGAGPKLREGDNRTPEGLYRISGRNPESAFHLSLRISYPGPRDVEAARALGMDPGGDIMIHGIRNGFGWLGALHRLVDWTAGCIAVTNGEIGDVWRVVADGTPIEIRP